MLFVPIDERVTFIFLMSYAALVKGFAFLVAKIMQLNILHNMDL